MFRIDKVVEGWRSKGISMHINAQLLPLFPQYYYIFHLGSPKRCIDYYQVIGHSAQDGVVGKFIVYFNLMLLHRLIGSLSDPLASRLSMICCMINCSVKGCILVFS